MPPDAQLVLAPGAPDLSAPAARLGLADVTRLANEPASQAGAAQLVLRTPGVVNFTSGSTGLPRPVYRPLFAVITLARATIEGFAMAPRGEVLAVLPLAHSYGFNHALMVAAVLGAPLTVLQRFDPSAVLRAFAARPFEYWPAMPVMAELLTRQAADGDAKAARVCAIAGRLAPGVSERFRARFGAPLRQLYGSTETGTIAIQGDDASPEPGTVGRLLRGVRVAIGDDPEDPSPSGRVGRVWVATPMRALGYGYPPRLEPVEARGEWVGTRDAGHLDGGVLALDGRIDDCVRTRAGYVVHPDTVARAAEECPGVAECVAVPVGESMDPVVGLLVRPAGLLEVDTVRDHLATRLPPWSQATVIGMVAALPRLAAGKIDRRACIEILDRLRLGARPPSA
jgi:long-chain acyl-CoA synthetase